MSNLRKRRGITISSTTPTTKNGVVIEGSSPSFFLPVDSTRAIHLSMNVPLQISVDQGTNLVLGSVCLDTDRFDPNEQIQFLIRFMDDDEGINNEENEGWSCLCNYLGEHRGGTSLPPLTKLGLEVTGRSVFQLCAVGVNAHRRGLHVTCRVVWVDDPDKDLISVKGMSRIRPPMDDALKAGRASSSLGYAALRGLLTHLPIRTMIAFFVILSLIRQGGGGFTTSVPSLHPTRRKVTSSTQYREEQLDSVNVRESPRQSPIFDFPAPPSIETKQPSSGGTDLSTSSPTAPQGGQTVSQPSSATMTSATATPVAEATTAFTSTLPPTQDNCINLTISFLPSWIEQNYPVNWTLSTITGEALWSKEYSDPALTNTMILEHASDDSLCLLPGSYTFGFNGAGEAHYLLSSGMQVIKCGGVIKEEYVFDFDLPTTQSSSSDNNMEESAYSQCAALLTTCDDNEDACLRRALIPLQCYLKGMEVDATGSEFNKGGNRTMWFSESCSGVLGDACQSGALGFGVGRESTIAKNESAYFCPYFECANAAFQEFNQNRGNLDEFYGCECQYTQWTCMVKGTKCDRQSCCLESGTQNKTENAISTSCSCRIEPDCDNGNAEMCDVALNYCCDTKQDFEKKVCEKKYSRIKCQESIEQQNIDENGGYSYCEKASNIYCEGDVDISGCQCSYWESLCTQYPEEAICEDAVDYCCPEDAVYGSYCYCDFYLYASNAGYKSEKMASWCSQSETYFTQISIVENDILGLEALYDNLGGEWWFDNSGWLKNETPHCEWFGVRCSEGRVSYIKLNNNNLTGQLTFEVQDGKQDYLFNYLFELKELDLSNNKITGMLESKLLFRHRSLSKVDVSKNALTGVADVLISPFVNLVNFSDNKFSSVGYMAKSRLAYKSIQTFDVGHNNIEHNAADFLKQLPPNLKGMIVKDNLFFGALPDPLPPLALMEVMDASLNSLIGTLPDFSRSMPRVSKINLSEQKHRGTGGLSGSIPQEISSLLDLTELDLSGNYLTGSIPPPIGNIPRLKLLNLSNNELTGVIDGELGKLSEVSEVFDLSRNEISGTIPLEMKDFIGGLVFLHGNEKLLGLAPLGLCYDIQGFDLKNDAKYCPPERNALQDFFNAAKGQEWTNSDGWGNQFTDPCLWYGITCSNVTNQPTHIHLASNGLSGILDNSIGLLRSLQSIDLSDNDIKGSISADIGNLVNLQMLRLSYNKFTGSIPSQLDRLQSLQTVQLQNNRLTGEIRLDAQLMHDSSSFISDCGVPTDFEDPLVCTNCTMCCNIYGACHTTDAPLDGFDSFTNFMWVLLLLIFVVTLLIALTKCLFDKYVSHLSRVEVSRDKILREKKNAFKTIGKDSVYSFFLSKNWIGWLIALSVMMFQFFVFLYFVRAAEKDFSDDRSDFVYSWRCPRNNIDCNDLADQTPVGWFTFGVLMITHLGKDIIQGAKLVRMSTKGWHHLARRLRFFVGGVLLILITVMAVYASTVYNYAIARSNAELVINAVIVLFLVEVDEQIYKLIEVTRPQWLAGLTEHLNDLSDDNISKTSDVNSKKLHGEDHHSDSRARFQPEIDHEIITDIYAKLQLIEFELHSARSIDHALNTNSDSWYQAQVNTEHSINEIRSQLYTMEQKTEQQFENIRLALQLYKSSTELISDSVRTLCRRTSQGELD